MKRTHDKLFDEGRNSKVVRMTACPVIITLDQTIGSDLLFHKLKFLTTELQLFLQHVPVLYWYPQDIVETDIKSGICACLFSAALRNPFHGYSMKAMLANMLIGRNNESSQLKRIYVLKKDDNYRLMESKLKSLLVGLLNDELFFLQALRDDKDALLYASNRLKDNEKIVLEAVKQNGNALEYASNRLKANEQIILAAKQKDHALGYDLVDKKEIKSDRDKTESEESNSTIHIGASSRLKKTEETILQAVKEDVHSLRHAPDALKDNEEFILKVVKLNGYALGHASDRLKDNEQIVLEAVKQKGMVIKFASNRLKDNDLIVLEAVKQKSIALSFASNRLRENEEFILQVVSVNGIALEFVSSGFKDNNLIVLEAMKQNGFAFKYASNRLKNDWNFANEIFNSCDSFDVFKNFGKELRNTEFIINYIEKHLSRFHELTRRSLK